MNTIAQDIGIHEGYMIAIITAHTLIRDKPQLIRIVFVNRAYITAN